MKNIQGIYKIKCQLKKKQVSKGNKIYFTVSNTSFLPIQNHNVYNTW